VRFDETTARYEVQVSADCHLKLRPDNCRAS
jgi:hypothetical protein